jgi:type I restriction enzyme S subunit
LENIGYGCFIDEKQSFVSEAKYQEIKRHTVVLGDIVFSSFVTDAIRSALVPSHIAFAVNKADCFGVRFLGTTINQKFVQLFFNSRNAFKQVESMIHGVGRPRINTSQLKEIIVPICSRNEQDLIVERVESAFSEIDALEAAIDGDLLRLASLRQSILKSAFSGRLVAQDPQDEPAAVLLERIKAGKQQPENRQKKNGRKKNGEKKAA